LASPGIALCAGTTPLDANPVGVLAVREWSVALGTQPVRAECRSTSRRTMDNDTAACDTGEEMTAECAVPCPCASPVHVEPPLGCARARDAAATSCALAVAARSTRSRGGWAITTPWGTADCTHSHPSFDARSLRLALQHGVQCTAQTWRALRVLGPMRFRAGMWRRRMSSRTNRRRRLWWLRLLQALDRPMHETTACWQRCIVP